MVALKVVAGAVAPSRTIALMPCSLGLQAAARPDGPAPTITTSALGGGAEFIVIVRDTGRRQRRSDCVYNSILDVLTFSRSTRTDILFAEARLRSAIRQSAATIIRYVCSLIEGRKQAKRELAKERGWNADQIHAALLVKGIGAR